MVITAKTKRAMQLMEKIKVWERRELIAASKIAALTAELQRVIESPPPSVTTGTIAERILVLLAATPDVAWSNGTVAKKLCVESRVVGVILSRLHKSGHVHKIARGLYQLSPKRSSTEGQEGAAP